MLENWLKKVSESVSSSAQEYYHNQLGHTILKHHDEVPLLKEKSIVIFSDSANHANAVRQHLYKMFDHFESANIVDLGDLRSTETNFLLGLFTELINSQVYCIILSNNKSVYDSYIQALELSESEYRLMCITQR